MLSLKAQVLTQQLNFLWLSLYSGPGLSRPFPNFYTKIDPICTMHWGKLRKLNGPQIILRGICPSQAQLDDPDAKRDQLLSMSATCSSSTSTPWPIFQKVLPQRLFLRMIRPKRIHQVHLCCTFLGCRNIYEQRTILRFHYLLFPSHDFSVSLTRTFTNTSQT